MPPRDVLVCVGNEILEATMSWRSKWYEYLCYRPLLEQYFKDDPNFVWAAAPKPRLTKDSYIQDYWYRYRNEWSDREKEERMHARKWMLTEVEPLFDAGDMVRFGKDLFVQVSTATNDAGISWLRRHFESRGLRLHALRFGGDLVPLHIDCNFFAPRPGLLMQNPKYLPLIAEFHELFRKNGWEVVMAEPPTRAEGHPIEWDTRSLAYNVFSLDPKTICVEAAETRLMVQLDELNLEVIPVNFHDVAPFGGGLHCGTVDVYREGNCEDYFPMQIEGF
jgi:glycine amidinotransferase